MNFLNDKNKKIIIRKIIENNKVEELRKKTEEYITKEYIQNISYYYNIIFHEINNKIMYDMQERYQKKYYRILNKIIIMHFDEIEENILSKEFFWQYVGLDKRNVNLEEIINELNFVEKMTGSKKSNIQQKIKQVIDLIKERCPVVYGLFAFLLPIIVNLIISQEPSNEYNVQYSIVENQNYFFVNRIGIVNAQNLNIKESVEKDSIVIGKLHCGDLVNIISKQKQWLEILYIKDDEILRGWVYSRYINKY